MTSKQTPQTPRWTAYVIFFLLTSLTSDGAILPSGTSSTSASAPVSSSATANQRFTRSAENLDPMERDMEDMAVDECSKDFVEMVFDVLEGPAGKEAEALLATVLKLLSENDRVQSLSRVDPDSPSEDVLSQPQPLLTSKRHLQLQGSNPDSFKRHAPKFNPTGWRRKRATYPVRFSLQQFLHRLLTKLRASRPHKTVSPKLPEGDVIPKFGEWRNKKRESLRKVLQRLPEALKPKRRPLEFNPTGW